ncbi:MAG: hypothetical protein CM15mP51_12440 [Porticoccaceae bacterium]|nr:MAG: hypothetical protein CM15mP51_12440 [Porticoccaceae bacterium]
MRTFMCSNYQLKGWSGLGWRKCPVFCCACLFYFCNSKLKLGKKEIMSFCTAIPALLVALPHIAKYAGYWPDNDSPILVEVSLHLY